ncbi:MAG TPA: RNA-binding protein hfq [Allocoleopsis sp.]
MSHAPASQNTGAEFDTNLPSIRQLIKLIQTKAELEIKLVTGDVLVGRILWQDINYICIIPSDDNQKQFIVPRNVITYLKYSP